MIALLLAVGLEQARPLDSKIQLVTLYSGNALVRRSAEVPGTGDFVMRGLPAQLDPNKLRVRCEGGEVVHVEPRLRMEERLSAERIEALRQSVLRIERDLRAVSDDRLLAAGLQRHLERLSTQEAQAHDAELRAGRPTAAAWGDSYEFLKTRMSQVLKDLRELDWRTEELNQALARAKQEYELARGGGGTQVYDVHIHVQAGGAAALNLEYFVAGTGWQPSYDLRTSRALDKVDLTYRAKIWQQTGEDWNDVQLVLSTAQPQLGAQGPDPVPQWVNLWQAKSLRGGGGNWAPAAEASVDKDAGTETTSLGFSAGLMAAPSAVVEEGLSVRFELRDKANIASRAEPTTVLVGNAALSIQPERVCVPAVDTTVWLRGRAKNTSPWVMLPGPATVFFGADYLGEAQMKSTMTGQEFTLHLGADPALTVEREQVEDQSKGPGFLSSRASQVRAWKLQLTNHGAIGAAADGSVEVIVREVLPRSKDERVTVELSKAEPALSNDPRWKKDREELGIQTWVLKVPKNDKGTTLRWQSTITYPQDARIVIE